MSFEGNIFLISCFNFFYSIAVFYMSTLLSHRRVTKLNCAQQETERTNSFMYSRYHFDNEARTRKNGKCEELNYSLGN